MNKQTSLLPILIIFFLIINFTETGFSQSKSESVVSEEFYDQLKWRNIGPNRGGRSLGASGSPGRPNEYYFGATGGGLWKTTDGAKNGFL